MKKPIAIWKIAIDVCMAALFLLLMSYHLLSSAVHEWLGVSLFALFLAHNALNIRWYGSLFRGRYSLLRVLQTAVNALLLLAMIGCIISSMAISGFVFSFLQWSAAQFGRALHLCATVWSFVLMSLHLGFHWRGMKKAAKPAKITLLVVALGICAYGIYVFVTRQLWEELFLLTEFKWFDYEKSLLVYLLENATLLVLFATIGYYLKKGIISIQKSKKRGKEKMKKTLVAYFSCTGNTARTAKQLARVMQADLYENKPSVPYSSADLNWTNKNSRSSVEMNDPAARPALADTNAPIADYDVVMLGFPIWWYVAPKIIDTFLESYDFSEKIVIPFATSGGSNFGKTEQLLKERCAPSTRWRAGKVLNLESDETLAAWIRTLGI